MPPIPARESKSKEAGLETELSWPTLGIPIFQARAPGAKHRATASNAVAVPFCHPTPRFHSRLPVLSGGPSRSCPAKIPLTITLLAHMPDS